MEDKNQGVSYVKTMEISKMVGEHIYVGANKYNIQATTNLIAKIIVENVKANPNITSKEMMNLIHSK